jgi:hypothetical protein
MRACTPGGILRLLLVGSSSLLAGWNDKEERIMFGRLE